MQTDNQLIRRIKKKQDKKAADELIQRYYREIYAFTYRQTGERELALDLTQEIFITVLQGIYAFDEKKVGFRTWAYRVAANRITDYYRSKSYKKEKLQQPLQLSLIHIFQASGLAKHAAEYPNSGTNASPTSARAIISNTPANTAKPENPIP